MCLASAGPLSGSFWAGIGAVAEDVEPPQGVVVLRIGQLVRLGVPHVADLMIAPAHVHRNPRVIDGLHDPDPVPQLTLEVLGAQSAPVDQVAGIDDEIHVPSQDLAGQSRRGSAR